MSDTPLVSVVTIFLDAERFLEEAIESVFAQTRDDWELLLVDDGSRDASTALARRFEALHPERVRVLEHPGHCNRGMSASRNLGIRHARGRYVAFLDADDVWLPHKLESQVALLEQTPEAAMVYGPTLRWFSWTGARADADRDELCELGVAPETLVKPPALLELFFGNGGAYLPGICSLLVRRQAILAVGGFEDNFRGAYEDQVFLAKLCLEHPVFITGRCTDRYRQHAASSCTVATREGEYHPVRPNPARSRYLRWTRRYLREQGCEDPGVWGALEKEVRRNRGLHSWLYQRAWVGRADFLARRLAKRALPPAAQAAFRALRAGERYRPPPGRVRFGSLRRRDPVDRDFGWGRGLPIDRYYIERFLARHADDVRGRVLEVGDAEYTRRFGADAVTRSDVLHVDPLHPVATFAADLACGDSLPSDAFDCVVCIQTLHFVYDVRAALATLQRILRPGGVLLATFPGISPREQDRWCESRYWSFTTLSARRLFAEAFGEGHASVEAHGNVLAATALLHGLAAEELRPEELAHDDPQYEVVVGVRAVKRGVRDIGA